jgi:hypothetical protein
VWRRVVLLAGGVDTLEPGGDKEASCTPPNRAHVQEEDTEDGVHLSRLTVAHLREPQTKLVQTSLV